MELAAVLWLALLLALVALFARVTLRMRALVARTRDLERVQQAVESVDRRLAGVVDPLVRGLDETRRHAGDPASLAAMASEAQVVIDALIAETRALVVPAAVPVPVTAMTAELERASRAASLVQHGLAALENVGIGRDLEGQTSIKRGTLNLRHAKDAFAQLARQVAALQPADLAPGAGSTAGATAAPAVDLPPESGGGDDV
ncbi:MAG TPA: hypothetical protein VFW02_04415 [Candidatus Limnocylindrales bacterium]|nr:hypothetical protein [Candidatus Limnocylindrales bacterium]